MCLGTRSVWGAAIDLVIIGMVEMHLHRGVVLGSAETAVHVIGWVVGKVLARFEDPAAAPDLAPRLEAFEPIDRLRPIRNERRNNFAGSERCRRLKGTAEDDGQLLCEQDVLIERHCVVEDRGGHPLRGIYLTTAAVSKIRFEDTRVLGASGT